MLTRHEIFRLQLLAGAGRETHAKVRQSFKPRAGHAHLLGAVFSGKLGDRVQIPGAQLCSEEGWSRVKRMPVFDATFYPNLVHALLLPVGKKAYAVGA